MKRPIIYILVGLAAVFIASAFAFAIFQPIKVLPRMRLAPGFVLTDQDGLRITNEDMRGRIVLYSFTYTRCQPPCSQPVLAVQAIQQRLNEVNLGSIPLSLITISFDPAHDTPDVMHAFAQSLGADPAIWRFTTLEDAAKLKILLGEGFRVYYQSNNQDGFQFDPVFVLVDGWGIIRGEYRLGTPQSHVDRILRHIQVLVEEVNKSQGPARLAYEAAHIFLCYAP